MEKLISLFSILCCLFSGMSQNGAFIGNIGVNELIYANHAINASSNIVAGQAHADAFVSQIDTTNTIYWAKTFRPVEDSLVQYAVMDLKSSNGFLYGCGLIHDGLSNVSGGFYFKMNALDGNLIWLKHENSSRIGFSALSINGNHLILAANLAHNQNDIKVMKVNPENGDIQWQTGLLNVQFNNQTGNGKEKAMCLSDIQNDKVFLFGSSNARSSNSNQYNLPVLIGLDMSGNIILQKSFILPSTQTSPYNIEGVNVQTDGNNLVMSFTADLVCSGSCQNTQVGLIKTTQEGNVLFAKTYDFLNQGKERVRSLHVSENNYVLFGGSNYSSFLGNAIALKTDKDGNIQTASLMYKQGTSMKVNADHFNFGGNTNRVNGGNHVYAMHAHHSNPNNTDFFLLKLREDLSQAEDNCLTALTETPVTTVLNNYSEDIVIQEFPNVIAYNTDSSAIDLFVETPGCDGNDILYPKEEFGCDSTILTISSSLGIPYQLQWAGGSTDTKTFVSDTALEIFFFNPVKCCEFNAIYYLELNDNPPTPILPEDSIICGIENYTVNVLADFQDCHVCQFTWSTGDTTAYTSIDSTGFYSVSMTNNCAKTTEDTIWIEYKRFPDVSMIPDSNICPADFPINLGVVALYSDSVYWSNGTVGNQATFTGPDTAYVEVSNACGIKREPFILIDYSPQVSQLDDIDTCIRIGDSVQISIPNLYVESWEINTRPHFQDTLYAIGDTVYTVTGSNKCGSDTMTFALDAHFFPEYKRTISIDTCHNIGDSMSIPVEVIAGNIEWNDPSVANNKTTQPGWYSFMVYSKCDTLRDSIQINMFDQPKHGQMPALDTCVPTGNYVELNFPQIEEEFEWTLNGLPSMAVNESGIYFARLSNVCGQIADSMKVTIRPNPTLAVPDSIDECADRISIQTLYTESNYPYKVFDQDGFQISEYVTESQTIVIAVNTVCGLIEAQVPVSLNDDAFIYAPNTFTPNNDQHNNTYQVYMDGYEVALATIFNRWGETVYQQIGAFDGWDGTYKGQVVNDGVYLLKLDLTQCENKNDTKVIPIRVLK